MINIFSINYCKENKLFEYKFILKIYYKLRFFKTNNYIQK